MKGPLEDLVGSRWEGEGELWLDPKGNEVELAPATIAIEDGAVRYTWSYRGEAQAGSLTLREGGADFTDTWHSPKVMAFEYVTDSWAIVEAVGTYAAGDGPPWGWRIALSLRPTGELILQMTNITPWGEDGRAVRMVCRRASA
jgi:hypothetical protein